MLMNNMKKIAQSHSNLNTLSGYTSTTLSRNLAANLNNPANKACTCECLADLFFRKSLLRKKLLPSQDKSFIACSYRGISYYNLHISEPFIKSVMNFLTSQSTISDFFFQTPLKPYSVDRLRAIE